MYHYLISYNHPRYGKHPYCFFSSSFKGLDGTIPGLEGTSNISLILRKVLDEGVFKTSLEESTWAKVQVWLDSVRAECIRVIDSIYISDPMEFLRVKQFEVIQGKLSVAIAEGNPLYVRQHSE